MAATSYKGADRSIVGEPPPETHEESSRPSGPVVLATLSSTPFDPRAASFAVEVAIESGAPLLVVNAVDLSVAERRPRHAPSGESDDVAAALRAPAELARSFGVSVERVRVHSARPITALLELVAAARPRVLVFGPEPTRLSRFRLWSLRRYRKVVRTLQSSTPCLMWLADERFA
jgi:nucleotide-binding universal stress UspA family protein